MDPSTGNVAVPAGIAARRLLIAVQGVDRVRKVQLGGPDRSTGRCEMGVPEILILLRRRDIYIYIYIYIFNGFYFQMASLFTLRYSLQQRSANQRDLPCALWDERNILLVQTIVMQLRWGTMATRSVVLESSPLTRTTGQDGFTYMITGSEGGYQS